MEKFSLELLEKVNSFYSDSFNQLITLTICLIAFIGVFVPLLFGYYQNRKSKLDIEALELKIVQTVADAQVELLEHIKHEIDASLKTLSDDNDIKIKSLYASIYHVQANTLINSGRYKDGGNSLITAIQSAIEAKDELNLGRQLNSLTNSVLPNLTLEEQPNIEAMENIVDKIEAHITDLNENGRYADAIRDLRIATKTAKQRLEKESKENED
ncbi:hypothetical protein AB4619_25535 [Vibrio splendidus]